MLSRIGQATALLALTPCGGSVAFRVYLPESHFTLSGGVFPQPIESVTPEEIWAQAFSVAVRRACASVEAPAVRHADRP